MLSIVAGLLMMAVPVSYQSPIADSIVLAGNFGEPRPNHFHGGIDVKTDGVEGKRVLAIGDGFVSRITMGLYGFGNAVYITHPEGYTSIYCHLREFSPYIKNALTHWRYHEESNSHDVRFAPSDVPVSTGQLIAFSGNTGHSMAPHLHLEIRESKTLAMTDPLDFIGHLLSDKKSPQAHAFMAYPQTGEGVFNGSQNSQSFGFGTNGRKLRFKAWGKVGFGLWANDYMENTYNSLGIRETLLCVDGKVVFRSNVNLVPVWSNIMVNSWGDYRHWLHYRRWYMKSFREPGNTLALFQTDENDGIINFNEEKVYLVEYILRDAFGNESKYTFEVEGTRQALSTEAPHTAHHSALVAPLGKTMKWDRINMWTCPGVQLVLPMGSIVGTIEPNPSIRKGNYSAQCSFHASPFPLFKYGEISLYVNRKVSNPSKLYLVEHYVKDTFMEGTLKNGWLTGKIRYLDASYEVAYDDEPPTIKTIKLGEDIILSVADGGSGLQKYTATLDGRFIAFEPTDKSPVVKCHLRESPFPRDGKKHKLKFTAIDNCSNASTYTATITY